MQKVKKALAWLENKLYKFLSAQTPVLHTAWQTAAGALVAGLVTARSTADVKAIVFAAVATFLAAVKAAYLKQRS